MRSGSQDNFVSEKRDSLKPLDVGDVCSSRKDCNRRLSSRKYLFMESNPPKWNSNQSSRNKKKVHQFSKSQPMLNKFTGSLIISTISFILKLIWTSIYHQNVHGAVFNSQYMVRIAMVLLILLSGSNLCVLMHFMWIKNRAVDILSTKRIW